MATGYEQYEARSIHKAPLTTVSPYHHLRSHVFLCASRPLCSRDDTSNGSHTRKVRSYLNKPRSHDPSYSPGSSGYTNTGTKNTKKSSGITASSLPAPIPSDPLGTALGIDPRTEFYTKFQGEIEEYNRDFEKKYNDDLNTALLFVSVCSCDGRGVLRIACDPILTEMFCSLVYSLP